MVTLVPEGNSVLILFVSLLIFSLPRPFANLFPVTGSFQVNPPDCEDLVDATLDKIEKNLETNMDPLSYIVFLPEVPELSEKLFTKLESNKFKRNKLTIPAFEHEYRHGFMHITPKNEVNVKAHFNTLIYFLQNDSGFLKWGPTPDKCDQLVESFKIGKDSEVS